MNTVAHTCGIRRARSRNCPACQLTEERLRAAQAAYLDLVEVTELLRAEAVQAELRGFARGREAAEAAYHTGLADAMLSIKRLNRGFVGELHAHTAMWGGRTRGRFSAPRRGDYPGGEAGRDKVAASWAAWEAQQGWKGAAS